jgi:hypothetical protein
MRRALFAVAGAIWLAIPTRVYACSCIWIASEQESLLRSDVAFRGTVTSVHRVERPGLYPMLVYTFRVHRWRKGGDGDSVDVETGFGRGDCGYPFEVDRAYTVYAYESASDHVLRTGICLMPWRPFAPESPKGARAVGDSAGGRGGEGR